MAKRKFWTKKEDELLTKLYPDTEMPVILENLPGRTVQAVYGRVSFLGVKRSEAFRKKMVKAVVGNLIQGGKKHRFKKGQEPPNKGLSQSEYMSPEAIRRSKATRFKNGQKPHNTKWDGAVTIRHGNKKRGAPPYMWIRITEGKWQQYQHYLWEKKNGPVAENHILACKDGDTLNPHPDNWEVITRAEHARRNRNQKKAAKTMKAIFEGKKQPKKITLFQAAKKLSGGDPDLCDWLLEHRPDLVRVALLNWKLKRKIRYGNQKPSKQT